MNRNSWFPVKSQTRVTWESTKCSTTSLNRTFELLLTQILCRRLKLGQGIVRLRVGLSYDLLRFIPRSTICPSSPFPYTLCWGTKIVHLSRFITYYSSIRFDSSFITTTPFITTTTTIHNDYSIHYYYYYHHHYYSQ